MRTAAAAIAVASAAACGPQSEPSGDVIAIDPDRYSGLVITLDSTGNEWQVGGLKENPDDELMTSSLLPMVARMHDGRYVLANEHRVRLLDSSGNELWRRGVKGSGPGEFGWIQQICVVGEDNVLVWDFEPRRFTVMDGRGQEISSFLDPQLQMSHCSPNGWFLGQYSGAADASGSTAYWYRRIDLAGNRLDSIDGGVASGVQLVGAFVTPSFGVIDSLIFRADPENGVITVFTLVGDTISRLQWRDRSVPVNDASIEKFIAANSQGDAATAAVFRRHLAAMERAPYWSRFWVVVSGGGGVIWIAEPLDSPEVMTLWGVSIEGEVVAKVLIPRTGDQGFLGFFPGGILHSWRDSDGALHVGARRVVGTGR